MNCSDGRRRTYLYLLTTKEKNERRHFYLFANMSIKNIFALIFFLLCFFGRFSWKYIDSVTYLHKLCFKIFFNVYLLLRDRETQSVSRGGVERGGDIESEVGSRLWAVSTEPDAALKLTNCEIMTWAKVRRSTDRATQVPLKFQERHGKREGQIKEKKNTHWSLEK